MNYLIGHDRCGWQAARERKTQENGAPVFFSTRAASRRDATRVS